MNRTDTICNLHLLNRCIVEQLHLQHSGYASSIRWRASGLQGVLQGLILNSLGGYFGRLHLVLGDVGGGVGDDAGDGDNDTGLGVDAGHTAYDAFEGAVGDQYHAAGAVVYLVVGDGI